MTRSQHIPGGQPRGMQVICPSGSVAGVPPLASIESVIAWVALKAEASAAVEESSARVASSSEAGRANAVKGVRMRRRAKRRIELKVKLATLSKFYDGDGDMIL